MKLVRSTSACSGPVSILVLLAACSSSTPGQPGPDGQSGAPGEPATAPEAPKPEVAINLVEPRVGLVARRIDVTIATSGKLDLAKATATFGEGIKVVKTAPLGNALVVTIEIDPDAALGKRDVVVEAGDVKLTAKSGFVVAVHLETKVGAGKAEQGGLVRLDLSNRDTISFNPDTFTLFPLAGQKDPSLVGLKYEGFTATDGSVVFLGDPLAKTGPLGFLGFNDPNDDKSPSYLTALDAVTVSARQPVELVSGTPVDKTFDKELETAFFVADMAPAANEGLLVEAWAQVPTDSTMRPLLLAYPKSGSAADLVDQAQNDPGYPQFGFPGTEARVAYPVTAASKGYFIVLDAALASGPTTKVSFDYRAVRAQIVAEKVDPHATGETAQNIGSLPGSATTVPGRVINGELKATDEVDVYKFTGLSVANTTDMLVSVIADIDVVVRVDTVPTFDSEQLLEITQGGKAGMNVTSGFVGKDRFIQVIPAPDSGNAKGKYSLGIKRLPAPPAPPITPP